MRPRRSVMWPIYLSAFILAAIGIVCILFSDKIVTLIASGNLAKVAAETPTTTAIETLFQSMAGDMIARLRIVGLLLAGLAVLILAGRRFVGAYLHEVVAAFPPFVRTLSGKIATWLRAEDRPHLGVFFAIVVLAAALRLAFLFQPIRYDEAYTYNNFASGPLYIGLANYALPNNHLFHTLLVHLATRFGSAEWLIRLPAFLAGIVLVPATYGFARRLHDKQTALLAAELVACSSTLIEYSTNARGYTLLTLFFLLDFWLALALIRSRGVVLWSLFGGFAILGFFSIPIMLYGWGAICVWLAVSMRVCLQGQERLRQLRRLVVTAMLVGIFSAMLYFPAYAAWGIEAIVANQFVAPLPGSDFIAGLPRMFSLLWSTWNRDVAGIVSAGLAGGFVIGLFASKRTANVPAYLLIPVTLLVCGVVLVVQHVIPFARVWMFLFPLYATFAAWGITAVLDRLVRRRAAIATYATAAIVCGTISLSILSSRSVLYSIETGSFRDAPQITAFLSGYLHEDDRVYVVSPSDAQLVYYFRRARLSSTVIGKAAGTLSAGNRIVIVDNKIDLYTVEDMLEQLSETGFPTAAYTDPELLASYEMGDLYVIIRR